MSNSFKKKLRVAELNKYYEITEKHFMQPVISERAIVKVIRMPTTRDTSVGVICKVSNGARVLVDVAQSYFPSSKAVSDKAGLKYLGI